MNRGRIATLGMGKVALISGCMIARTKGESPMAKPMITPGTAPSRKPTRMRTTLIPV